MLEKRTIVSSHHKSGRGGNATIPEPPSFKQVSSEVVAASNDKAVVQIKQNQYDLVQNVLFLLIFQFAGSVRNGLQEAKSSRDPEDFWYNIETKVSDSKNSMTVAIASIILYACENIKLDSPEFKQLVNALSYGFENTKINEQSFMQGFDIECEYLIEQICFFSSIT